jgi:hypothetical protein
VGNDHPDRHTLPAAHDHERPGRGRAGARGFWDDGRPGRAHARSAGRYYDQVDGAGQDYGKRSAPTLPCFPYSYSDRGNGALLSVGTAHECGLCASVQGPPPRVYARHEEDNWVWPGVEVGHREKISLPVSEFYDMDAPATGFAEDMPEEHWAPPPEMTEEDLEAAREEAAKREEADVARRAKAGKSKRARRKAKKEQEKANKAMSDELKAKEGSDLCDPCMHPRLLQAASSSSNLATPADAFHQQRLICTFAVYAGAESLCVALRCTGGPLSSSLRLCLCSRRSCV